MNYYNNETILEQQKQIENLTTALQKVSDYNLRLENERDALAAQIAIVKTSYWDLCCAINNLDDTDTDSEEIIDEMWGQVFSVMQDGWNSFSRNPQRFLAEIKAEAIESLLPKCIYSTDHKVEIITKDMVKYFANQVRQGGE